MINKDSVIYKLLFILCLTMLISCGSVPEQQKTSDAPSLPDRVNTTQGSPEAHRRQVIYMEYLDELGLNPYIDNAGDIVFINNDQYYYVIIGNYDPTFVMLLKNIYTIASDREQRNVVNAIMYANSGVKVAKLFLVGANNRRVNGTIELFLDNPNDFRVLFLRSFNALELVESRFFERL